MPSSPRLTRTLIAARSSLLRAGLESVVRSSSFLEFAGALDWASLDASDFAADVLLLHAGGMDADALQPLLDALTLPVILLVDSAAEHELIASALRAGVRGVLLRDASPEEIESAAAAVHAGLSVTANGMLQDLISTRRPDPEPAEALADPLSDRELEVLDLIAEGLSNKLIAHRLGISEHTVKTHVASVLAKLGATSRTEAVAHAIRRGLVML